MIVGVGIDVVDVERFGRVVDRSPGVLERLFTVVERESGRPLAGLAAAFAAKEALAKALGAPGGLRWHDAEVRREVSGRPSLALRGGVAAVADALGVRAVCLSLSHDGGIAMALVVAEGWP